MQLAILLAIFLSLALASAASAGAPFSTPQALLLVASLLPAPLLAACGSLWVARGLRRDFPVQEPWLRTHERLEQIVAVLWLAGIALAFTLGRWPQLVRQHWGLADWPLVDDVVLLLPALAPLAAVWLAQWHVERTVWSRLYGAPPQAAWLAHLARQARQHLALPLAPVVALALVQDAVPLCGGWLGVREAPSWALLLGCGGVLIVIPWFVRRAWPTFALPEGERRARLASVFEQRGVALQAILVWDTGGRMANAAIVGLTPLLRHLLLTDVLLRQLSDDQLEAVVRHELGHVTRRHLPLRLLVLCLPLWWWQLLGSSPPAETCAAWLEAHGLTGWANVLAPALAAAYAVAALGWCSRLLEHDADLAVLDDLAPRAGEPWPALAAERVTHFLAALARVCPDANERGWLHPTVARRRDFLRRCLAEPARAAGFRRRMRLLSASVLLLYVVPLALAAWRLW